MILPMSPSATIFGHVAMAISLCYASSIPSIPFGLRKLVVNAVEIMRTMKKGSRP